MDEFDMMQEDRLSGFSGFEMDDGDLMDGECEETSTEEDEDA